LGEAKWVGGPRAAHRRGNTKKPKNRNGVSEKINIFRNISHVIAMAVR